VQEKIIFKNVTKILLFSWTTDSVRNIRKSSSTHWGALMRGPNSNVFFKKQPHLNREMTPSAPSSRLLSFLQLLPPSASVPAHAHPHVSPSDHFRRTNPFACCCCCPKEPSQAVSTLAAFLHPPLRMPQQLR
jgi:hypothetical protein